MNDECTMHIIERRKGRWWRRGEGCRLKFKILEFARRRLTESEELYDLARDPDGPSDVNR